MISEDHGLTKSPEKPSPEPAVRAKSAAADGRRVRVREDDEAKIRLQLEMIRLAQERAEIRKREHFPRTEVSTHYDNDKASELKADQYLQRATDYIADKQARKLRLQEQRKKLENEGKMMVETFRQRK